MMHELSICQSITKQVEIIAAQHDATAITSIKVQIGPLSGVEAALLQEAFPIASTGTVADKAKLIIETAPIRVHCNTCHAETEAQANRLLCGACGDYHTRLISGDEMVLAQVELVPLNTQGSNHQTNHHHTGNPALPQ